MMCLVAKEMNVKLAQTEIMNLLRIILFVPVSGQRTNRDRESERAEEQEPELRQDGHSTRNRVWNKP